MRGSFQGHGWEAQRGLGRVLALLLLCWDRLRPLNMQAITYHQATGLSFFETGGTCVAQASLKDVLCLSLPADWDSSRYIPLSFSCDCSLKDHCLLSP